ncbi:MAG: ABC transporter substrate-binding protein [Candidatus Lambdaproteobacteria bacterium]|nr:ABC transporter substrate-binding protein [Candidatus Lambdaproteobacteria bacterium]
MVQTKVRNGVLRLLAAALVVCGIGAGASAQETPRRGGVLSEYLYGDPAVLDIQTGSEASVQHAVAGIYGGLLTYDPERPREIVPDLATRHEASPDGKTYTFHLRERVKWHDGQPFTAADVKATFDRVLTVRSPRCGSLMKPILKEVRVLDGRTVRFELKYPTATFESSIASAWCVIVPKHILERDGDLKATKSMIGTGPFKFKRYERDSVIEWERNPDYYDPRFPYLDGVKQYIIVGKARQMAAVKAGQVHLPPPWPAFTGRQIEEIKAARGDRLTYYTWPINNVSLVFFNTTKPPFDTKDMRRAVHLAIDRQEFFEKLYDGIGSPCSVLETPVYGDFGLSAQEVLSLPGCRRPKDADLAEARRLVAKHYPNGVDVEVAVRTVGDYVDRASLVIASLAKVGIRGRIKTYESAAGISAYNKGEFTLIGPQDTASFVQDPSSPFAVLFTSKGGRNFGKWKDAQVDAWADQALRETDPARRRELYHRLERYLLTEDTGGAVIGGIGGWFFIDKRVKNYHRSPTTFDNNTMMKVWLAE